MSEWLDLMLEEINRKKQEAEDAKKESERRASRKDKPRQQKPKKDSG